MTPKEAAYVLSVAASYDSRRPSTAEAQTWAHEFRQTAQTDVIAAVREHYRRRPDDRIRPGHVHMILAEQRRLGLANVSRVEQAALAALDPDDPHYTAKAQRALAEARQRAATDRTAIPAHPGLPAGPEDPSQRAQRTHRGAAAASAAIRGPDPKYRTQRTGDSAAAQDPKIAAALAAHRAQQRAPKGTTPVGRGLGSADPAALVAQFKTIPERTTDGH